jgi:hypothetical protein
MMFMMPMPPTTSDGGLGEFLLAAHGEVGFAALAALLEQVGHVTLHLFHHLGRLGLDDDRVEIGTAGEAAQVAGVGDDDRVVLVLPEVIEALGGEHADDLERDVADAHRLPDGIGFGEELVGDGLAEDGDLGPRQHVGLGEHRALGERPGADIEVGDVLAEDLGVPVEAAGHDLGAIAHLGADGGNAGDLLLNGERIFHGERTGRAPAAAHAAGREVAGEDGDDVLAEAGDGGLDLGFGAVADADDGDHRGDADDDAQGGQHGAQRAATQRAEGDLDDVPETHGGIYDFRFTSYDWTRQADGRLASRPSAV